VKVLLIDADSTIPNISLKKLSTWHKSLGDDVELVRVNLPYYPKVKGCGMKIYKITVAIEKLTKELK